MPTLRAIHYNEISLMTCMGNCNLHNMTILLLILFSLPITFGFHILIFDRVSLCNGKYFLHMLNMRSLQVEGVIHFENDIEELQQWDHQVTFFNIYAQCLHFDTAVFWFGVANRTFLFIWSVNLHSLHSLRTFLIPFPYWFGENSLVLILEYNNFFSLDL